MKKYQSIKKVEAVEMEYHKAGREGLIRDYDMKKEGQEGYKVVYEDGYESWSPKSVFDKGYIKIDNDDIAFDVEAYDNEMLEAVLADIAKELEVRGANVDYIESIVHCNVKNI